MLSHDDLLREFSESQGHKERLWSKVLSDALQVDASHYSVSIINRAFRPPTECLQSKYEPFLRRCRPIPSK
jgi:hypothetical protein